MYNNSPVQSPRVANPWLKTQVFSRRLKLLSMAAIALSLPISLSINRAALAQVPRLNNIRLAQNLPSNLPPPRDVLPPTSPPQQEIVPSTPPPPEQLLPSQPLQPPQKESIPQVPQTFTVTKFEFKGGTVFDEKELLRAMEFFLNNPQAVEVFLNNPENLDQNICKQLSSKSIRESPPLKLPRTMSFAQLLQARLGITQLYICEGYITSGAVIPAEQVLQPNGGVVTIELVEGSLEDIKITGNRRLNRSYIRSRLRRADKKPLNREDLLEALQLLQLNPRLESLSAELAAGSRFGTNLLEVNVKEANTFHGEITLDNNRSPSVGSFQRSAQLREENLTGIGDTIALNYANTDGSDQVDLSYTLPLSPRDTTLTFSYGFSSNNIIEEPFEELDIESDSDNYQLSLRHPVIQTPTKELALGLTLSHQRTQTFLGYEDIGATALSPGADEKGRTRVSALRFSQEWTQRGDRSVFALRSQFSVGLNVFDATINDDEPDSQFFTWRGQAQWVQSLAPDTLLVLRGGVQLADRRLLSLEKFGVGGPFSVRGYRHDQLLTDNGAFGSVELRLPILRNRSSNTLLQIAPFFEVGTAWNSFEGADLDPNTLVSTGLGLRFQMSDRLNARLDWGIPLVSVDSDENTLQEQGLYFSLQWNAL